MHAHPCAANAHKFLGIRNGIDADIWSPEDNPYLPMCYSAANVEEGKRR
jgi:starch synthase